MYAHPAAAVENVVFGANLGATSRLLLTGYLDLDSAGPLDAYEAARVDLNEDGMDEIVLRERGCAEKEKICAHLFLAQTKDKIFKISEIQTRYIMLAGTYSDGVRDILAFRNEKNDYDFDLYVWDSRQSRYRLEREEKAAKVEE